MPTDWLKLSEWRYKHSTAPLTIDHDTDGWVLSWPIDGKMWPNKFTTPEAAMQFALPWTRDRAERHIA